MSDYELIKFIHDEIELDVNVSPNEDTVWLMLEQISLLFNRDRSVIGKHIKNIYKESELDENATRANFAHVQIEGNREISREISYYNLDVVISVGYRVRSKNGIIFRKWANNVLKQYLIKGYIINEDRTLVTNENYVNLINRVESIDNRLHKIESNNIKNNEEIFFDGEFFDAKSFISSLISKANETIVLIDSYADIKSLDFIKNKKQGVSVEIYHSSKAKLSDTDIDTFNLQYGDCSHKIIDSFHDRFIIIDDSDLYYIGTSLNYVGKKTFAISRIEDENILKSIMEKI